MSSSDDSDTEESGHTPGFYFALVVYLLFVLLIPIGLFILEARNKWLSDVESAMLDNSHIFELTGARFIDLNTQSKIVGRLVLIPDEPEFDEVLHVEPLGLFLPRMLAARVYEEEIEEDSPGSDEEHETTWVEKTDYFHGYSKRVSSRRVFLGPDKLISQYLQAHPYTNLVMDSEMMTNATQSQVIVKNKFNNINGQYFYKTEDASDLLDYRFTVQVVPMKEFLTVCCCYLDIIKLDFGICWK